jgi:hypothetical protein
MQLKARFRKGIQKNRIEAKRVAEEARQVGCPECETWTETAIMYFGNADFYLKKEPARALDEYEAGLRQLGKAVMCVHLRARPDFFAGFGRRWKKW